MKNLRKIAAGLPVKVYTRVSLRDDHSAQSADTNMLLTFRGFLRDRPGSLAAFSSLIAECGDNISFFHYDRSVDSSCVSGHLD